MAAESAVSEPPQIVSFAGPDQVARNTEVTLTWKLAGGDPKQIAIDGKSVSGESYQVKVVEDPTCFTLTASNDFGTATMKKWIGTHADGECVSTWVSLELPDANKLTDDGHAYRADSIQPAEIARVKKNLATMDSVLRQITGMRSGHDATNLERRLKAIKKGHAPADMLKLINQEFDRERASTIWPHMSYLAHGGKIQQNHTYRVSTLSQQEIARVKKNLADLKTNISAIPGFEKVQSVLEEKLKNAKTIGDYNRAFEAEHEALLQIHPPKDQDASAPHPYRAKSTDATEIQRVQENLKKLSAGLHKITNLGDAHSHPALDAKVQQVELETPKPGHALDMINHHFDQARMAIVARHAPHIHHGSSEGSQHVGHGHPFRIHRLDPSEIQRVSKSIVNLGTQLAKIPGFGGRFNAATHLERLKKIKPGATPSITLRRYNDEFDWERRNMLQMNVQPQKRPPIRPGADDGSHAYRASSHSPKEIARVTKNLGLLSKGLSAITSIPETHNPANLAKRIKGIRAGHSPQDALTLLNAEFDRERTTIIFPHTGFLAHGGAVGEGHSYRASSTHPDEVSRVFRNLGRLAVGLAKVPGLGNAMSKDLLQKLKGAKSKDEINGIFDKERAHLLNVKVKPENAKGTPPYRAVSNTPQELARVQKNMAALAAGLSSITRLGNTHDSAAMMNLVKQQGGRSTPAHTLDLINHHFDQERAKIIGRHAGVIHHGNGPGSEHKSQNHAFRVGAATNAEIARVKQNIHKLATGLMAIPGFGTRFDAGALEQKLKSVGRGPPAQVMAKLNALFDHERHNLLQVKTQAGAKHVKPPLAPVDTSDNHAFRVVSPSNAEVARVKENLLKLSQGLVNISGVRGAYDPKHLDARLKAIRPGHNLADHAALINAELDRMRTQIMAPHMGHLAHGGTVLTGHQYRVGMAAKSEIERVKKNLKTMEQHLSKVPGFGGKLPADLDKALNAAKKNSKLINKIFDKARAELLNVHPKKQQEKTHPYRAMKNTPQELERVRKNIATLSGALSKITGLPGNHNPQRLHETVSAIKGKKSPAHDLDMINHHFDTERAKIIGRHVMQIHHGVGKGSLPRQKNHPYRIHSTAPAEINRVKQNIAKMAQHVASIPGFGKRFDAALHAKRLAAIKPSPNAAETIARLNKEFDWERHNMLHVHVQPQPRPVHP